VGRRRSGEKRVEDEGRRVWFGCLGGSHYCVWMCVA